MKTIRFTKMQGAGNDFVVASRLTGLPVGQLKKIVQKLCDRKYGVGADGVLLLEKSKKADIKMRIFNADGTEAEMCGNGARCAAHWAKSKIKNQKSKILKIETKAGIIEAEVKGDNVKIKLSDPKDIKLDIPIKINNRILKVNFINTGVPHAIVFVEGIDNIDVFNLGRQIRYHKEFAPRGTNVDFVEIINKNSIFVRTYERGVESETLACGTGSVASAIISNIKYQKSKIKNKISKVKNSIHEVKVMVESGEILKVCFEKCGDSFKNVWLEGKVEITFKGVFYV